MSIRIRLVLLLGVLLIAFLAALQILRRMERTQAETLRRESLQSDQFMVRRWIDLVGQPLQRFVQDYSQWEELAEFAARPDDSAWAEENLRQSLPAYDAHALWLLDAQGQLIYSGQRQAGAPLPPPAELGAPATGMGTAHYFAESRDGLLEIWRQPVDPAGTGQDPRAQLLVARLWNDRFLATLSRLTGASMQFAPAEGLTPGEPSHVQLLLPLQDGGGVTLRRLQARFPLPDFTATIERDNLAARLFVVFGLLVIVALWLGVRQWVLRPLGLITASLASGQTAPIARLLTERTELGRVAGQVAASFAQRSALEREIEERRQAEAALRESENQVRHSLELRARLARDLHDGVIQSIYAAGLGLESAVSLLATDQAGARTRLQLCRQSLNDVIREVRGFIGGLEPEQMQRQSFIDELAALARTMQALWPVRIVLQVDPHLARQLSAGQEVHALQIVRECISNALRHGDAKEVRIRLEQNDAMAALIVSDDGRGFDPEKVRGEGRGLQNLATRAREMGGGLRVDSGANRGATLTVSFKAAGTSP